MRATGLLPLLLLTACTIGPPPGFSGGDSWSFPLVTPLEGGPLLVAVTIHDHGPYLFKIDPDAPFSEIDSALVGELELRSSAGPEFVDESDKARNVMLAEVHHVKLGTLSIDKTMTWFAVDIGTFNTAGHQVRGVLGRDVIADSLVFGFDRKAGMGYMTTAKKFQKPADAVVFGTSKRKSRVNTGVRAVTRKVVGAKIQGKGRTVHVDFGDVTSRLRRNLWEDTGLTPIELKRQLVDEAGTHTDWNEGALASTVEIGGLTARNVLFLPYVDSRWEETELDGTVGLAVFDGHAVWVNWNDGNVYVTAEADTTVKQRIARWGSTELDACEVPACTTVELLVPPPSDDATAPPPRPIMSVTRTDAVKDIAIEVMVSAGDDLPQFVVIFPQGETQVSLALDPTYAERTLEVVDVSPFPRACQGSGACVYQLAQ